MHMHTDMYVPHTQLNEYMNVRSESMHVWMCMCVYVCMHVHIYVHTYLGGIKYVCIYIVPKTWLKFTHMCMSLHAYIHIITRIYTYHYTYLYMSWAFMRMNLQLILIANNVTCNHFECKHIQ